MFEIHRLDAFEQDGRVWTCADSAVVAARNFAVHSDGGAVAVHRSAIADTIFSQDRVFGAVAAWYDGNVTLDAVTFTNSRNGPDINALDAESRIFSDLPAPAPGRSVELRSAGQVLPRAAAPADTAPAVAAPRLAALRTVRPSLCMLLCSRAPPRRWTPRWPSRRRGSPLCARCTPHSFCLCAAARRRAGGRRAGGHRAGRRRAAHGAPPDGNIGCI